MISSKSGGKTRCRTVFNILRLEIKYDIKPPSDVKHNFNQMKRGWERNARNDCRSLSVPDWNQIPPPPRPKGDFRATTRHSTWVTVRQIGGARAAWRGETPSLSRAFGMDQKREMKSGGQQRGERLRCEWGRLWWCVRIRRCVRIGGGWGTVVKGPTGDDEAGARPPHPPPKLCFPKSAANPGAESVGTSEGGESGWGGGPTRGTGGLGPGREAEDLVEGAVGHDLRGADGHQSTPGPSLTDPRGGGVGPRRFGGRRTGTRMGGVIQNNTFGTRGKNNRREKAAKPKRD